MNKEANWCEEYCKIITTLNGHIVRMEDNRRTTRLTIWTPRTHNGMRGTEDEITLCDDLDRFQTQSERPFRDRRRM